MSKSYSISIINEYAYILFLSEKNDKLTVIETLEIELSELSAFVKNKKNLHISVENIFEFSQNIKVPATITNSKNIKNYILYKIKEINPDRDVLFNFKKLPKQNDEENIIYSVEAIDENSYIASLSFVTDFSKITSATTNKFALLSLSNRCIDEDNYICVHANATTVTVLAIEQKELIFSRATLIDSSDAQAIQINIAENITQTLSYISNQFRDIQFKTLALSGSIALDDVITQHILMLNNLNISILYPNSFVQNIDAEESQAHILSLGAYLVEKTNQFLPKKLLALRQFNFTSSIFLALSGALLFVMLYFVFDAYIKYTDLTTKNEVLKSRYLNLFSKTKMLPEKELKKYTNHISMVKKYLKNSPVDTALILKPLIELDKPTEFDYKDENGIVSFKLVFEKHFKELKNLYKFEKEFNSKFRNINTIIKIEKKTTIDYEKMIYKTNINTVDKSSIHVKKRKRRQ